MNGLLSRASKTEASDAAKDEIIGSLKGNLGDLEYFKEIDINNVTEEQIDVLERLVTESAAKDIETIVDLIDAANYVDDGIGVIIDGVLDGVEYVVGEEASKAREELRQINKDVDEALEGMMAEAFKDGSVYEAASSVFSDDYCEAIR